uniref:Apple domain-containing protein n=1 Tax=Sparus aurata TaxID=8175 RepID=A0A671U0R1_SPAAU
QSSFYVCIAMLSHSKCTVVTTKCRRELQVNVNFPGADIKSLWSPDAEHCQYLCTQHPTCLIFSFIRPDWTRDNRQFFCYLKTTPSRRPKHQHPTLGITSEPCLPQLYHHVVFNGNPYKSLFTADPEECQRACTHDPDCQFFAYFKKGFPHAKRRFMCHLKFSRKIPRIPRIIRSASRISGFSQRIQHTQNFHVRASFFHTQTSPGFDIDVLPAVSPEHCQTFCSVHPLCTYFSYISHTFKCYLKNNPHHMPRIAAAGITSGLPTRFCQPNNSKTYVGIDFPHSDIRHFKTDGVEWCRRTCTEDPSCQYFSIVAKYNMRHCFLKRVITMPILPRITKHAHFVSGFSLRNCQYKAT